MSARVLDELRSQRLPIGAVVSELITVLGAGMVAVIGGGTSTRAVRGWRDGEYEPKEKDRLRFALRVVDVLATCEQPDVVRAWFGGLNHLLGDENPALLIAKGSDAERRAVLSAARAFISH